MNIRKYAPCNGRKCLLSSCVADHDTCGPGSGPGILEFLPRCSFCQRSSVRRPKHLSATERPTGCRSLRSVIDNQGVIDSHAVSVVRCTCSAGPLTAGTVTLCGPDCGVGDTASLSHSASCTADSSSSLRRLNLRQSLKSLDDVESGVQLFQSLISV